MQKLSRSSSGQASPMDEAMIKHLKEVGYYVTPSGHRSRRDAAHARGRDRGPSAHPLIAAMDPGGAAKIGENTGKTLKIDGSHGARIALAAGARASRPSSGPPRATPYRRDRSQDRHQDRRGDNSDKKTPRYYWSSNCTLQN